MNIEEVQRMNAMASELRKHNFASSSDDAFQQAKQMFVPQEQVALPKPKLIEENNVLLEKKFELMMQMNNKRYEQEISLLRSAFTALANEFEVLRAQLSRVQEQAPPRPKEKQEPLKTETKEAHPRQGNFTSDDVSIQKMFYFGNKK